MTQIEVSRAPARRRGRRPVALLAVLAVLVGLVVAADRAAAWYAERRLAEQASAWAVRAGAEPGVRPQARVEGFPFLTQVLLGRYDGVLVTVRNVGAGGLVADRLEVHLTDVDLPFADLRANDFSRARAAAVTATAHIPLSEFATALSPRGITVRVEGDRLRIKVPFEIAGYKSSLSGLADVSASEGRLHVRFSDLRAAGAVLPPGAADAVTRQLATIIEAPKLPYGLQLQRVQVTPDGLAASATGRNVRLAG